MFCLTASQINLTAVFCVLRKISAIIKHIFPRDNFFQADSIETGICLQLVAIRVHSRRKASERRRIGGRSIESISFE